jgi:tetratricopeptide (TPR) repeat protein
MNDYSRVINLDPENTHADYHRGLTCKALGQTDLAIKDFEKILEITADPNLGKKQ